eukprot:11206214-Lingulodinium_polyedra.AAC.1
MSEKSAVVASHPSIAKSVCKALLEAGVEVEHAQVCEHLGADAAAAVRRSVAQQKVRIAKAKNRAMRLKGIV